MKTYTITIRDCLLAGTQRTTRVRAATEAEARDRAVRKLYGKTAWLWQDSGLPVGYGQITKPLRSDSYTSNCITGRVCVQVAA
jgi:hypothetical protein